MGQVMSTFFRKIFLFKAFAATWSVLHCFLAGNYIPNSNSKSTESMSAIWPKSIRKTLRWRQHKFNSKNTNVLNILKNKIKEMR